MNLETINKWLDEEYGCSYTRLEELHDWLLEENIKLKDKNQQLKKQKDDVVDWLNNNYCYVGKKMTLKPYSDLNDLLRMLGEIDEL